MALAAGGVDALQLGGDAAGHHAVAAAPLRAGLRDGLLQPPVHHLAVELVVERVAAAARREGRARAGSHARRRSCCGEELRQRRHVSRQRAPAPGGLPRFQRVKRHVRHRGALVSSAAARRQPLGSVPSNLQRVRSACRWSISRLRPYEHM
jgi:hypothetical protein